MAQPGRYARLLILAIAVLLPLAGAILAVLQWTQGDRGFATQIAVAAVLGVFLYALVFG